MKGGQGDLHPQPRGLGAGGPSPAAEWEEVLGGFSRPRGVQGSAVWGAAWPCVRHVLGTSADSAQISSWLESLSFPELQGISWRNPIGLRALAHPGVGLLGWKAAEL